MITAHPLPPSFQIRLTSPLTLSRQLEKRVNELWMAALSSTNSRLFNGLIFSATSVSPEGILGRFVEYKYYIAQQMDARLTADLKIKPVCLSGVLTCFDGFVFGKRQDWFAIRPGSWGLMPSGCLTPDTFATDGSVDYVKAFLYALKDDLNIEAHFLSDLSHNALIVEDTAVGKGYSLVMNARIALSSLAIKRYHANANTDKYSEIAVIPPEDVEQFLFSHTGHDIEKARALLCPDKELVLETICA